MEPVRETAFVFAEMMETQALEEIERGAAALGQAAAAAGARVIKRIGPRLMLLAASIDQAAAAAVAMQVTGSNSGVALGVGFHFGPVIQREDGDVFGDTVNLAARLVEQAARGQILLAADTAGQLGSLYRRSARRLYALPLKGIKEEIALCELVWRADDPATFFPVDTGAEPEPERAKIKLKYHGAKHVYRRISETVMIGRGADCDLVIADEHASRLHCTIQRRRERFILADKSTNGTYVTIEGEPEVLLQREDFTLRKRGWITFGRPRAAAGDEVLEFSCDD